MKIQSMFQKDIDRPINGVVKVMQDDQQSLKDELSEYIITKELRRHFATFFDNYVKTIDTPTDKIGVWISGFFGSGKSHFLKMLSYLLSNKEVDGKHAFDYFADKFDDPMMYATVQKCVRIPTESILFNIDIEGPINKDKTAVLRVFAKVFYNHCGFYGEDLKVAKLERFIDKQGKTDAFRAAFKEVNGEEWVNARDSAAFFEDEIPKLIEQAIILTQGYDVVVTNPPYMAVSNAGAKVNDYVKKNFPDSKADLFAVFIERCGQMAKKNGYQAMITQHAWMFLSSFEKSYVLSDWFIHNKLKAEISFLRFKAGNRSLQCWSLTHESLYRILFRCSAPAKYPSPLHAF